MNLKNITKRLQYFAKSLYSSPLFWSRLTTIAMCTIAVELFLLINDDGDGEHTIPVYVTGGNVDVSGSVDVDNTVQVEGSVDVDNTVRVSGFVGTY